LRSRWGDVDGRRRREYELTAHGRKELARHRSEWDRFAAGVRAVLEQ
jgi:DNA-binding PadR family transcriptional regulator